MNIRSSLFFILILCLYPFYANTQTHDSTSFKFTVIKELPHTPVKDQYHTGTCWAFSAISFFESEMLRMGKPEANLSEMFVVNYTYRKKAWKYVRMDGGINFGPGGEFYDVIDVINNYGLVPDQIYHGIKYDEKKYDNAEMDEVLKKMVEAVVEKKGNKITNVWPEAFDKSIDSYLGNIPNSFEFKGQKYTPKSFVSDYCGINTNDYVQITSFSHHPFYKPFALEVPDNWMWSDFYNVPLDELQKIIDNSLDMGYTVAWAADVTEKGFLSSKYGIAVVPDLSTNTNRVKIDTLTGIKEPIPFNPLKPFKEKKITQESRQVAFDEQETTDDHGMHIIGLAKDQNGKIYYKVKNSWGDYNNEDGYFYASIPYVLYKTTSIMVNKNCIPDEIRKKLGL